MLPPNYPSPPGQPQFRAFRLRTLIIATLLSGIFGGVIGAGVILILDREPAPPVPEIATAAPEAISRLVETAITDVVENVGPAVVTVINNFPPRRTFFGGLIESAASGSGVIISSDGYIVTNNHVVSGAQSLEVILADGSVLPAKLIGVEEYSDLAILQVDGDIVVPASWGNSDMLKAGEPVVAIGSPLGDFTNTVTQGVVSAVERTIEIEEDYFLEGLIQTDAAINQGNSGGPLLNTSGQVIGINTLIVRGSGSGAVAEGLGFAIPSNTARAIADQLIAEGFFARPYPGIRWVNITPSLASRYRLPAERGIFITEIDPKGPAESAGLQRGDIITALSGELIDENHPFRNILFQYEPGETVEFTYIHEGTVRTADLTLGAMR
jgi:S1-C subfamily serine protease